MKKITFMVLYLSAITSVVSCSNDKDAVNDPGTITDPVETDSPNTSYQPAFGGQTRASGLQTNSAFEAKIITSSLASPWSVKQLPDGRILVAEKGGQFRIVTARGEVGNAIAGIPSVNTAGQGGLLGFCFDPDFSSNRMIYWVFSESVSGGNITAVAKGQLAADFSKIEAASVIFRTTPPNPSALHYGGRILFDKNGNLMISTGERSVLETRPLAQSLTGTLGKVIRLTKEGDAAANNPVFPESAALPEIYSYGHRNPQGLAMHPVTGEVWLSEHGPRGGDEINRLIGGTNYGWPVITYGIEYSGEAIGDAIQKKEGMEQPVYYWDPVISPSGMTFYSGKRVPEWENNLFVGALSGKHIARLAIENNKVVGEERLLSEENQRFRDITQGNDGALYAVTDEGRLYKIDKK
jgi:glucose/arabinose dehydrogenase